MVVVQKFILQGCQIRNLDRAEVLLQEGHDVLVSKNVEVDAETVHVLG